MIERTEGVSRIISDCGSRSFSTLQWPRSVPIIMKIRSLVFAIACLASASLHAQWLKYPTPGTPRLPDGRPNLSAPAPKAADGKPDLSGIWQLRPRPCPPEGCSDDYPVGAEFINFGAQLKGGLPYQPWAAALAKERTEQLGKDD